MEIFVAIVVVLVAIVAAVIVIGRSLPVAHVASRTVTFRRPPDEVWTAINDPSLLASRGVGEVKFETIGSVPPKLLVRRVRFVSRFIIGHHRTIDGTMGALRKRFGES